MKKKKTAKRKEVVVYKKEATTEIPRIITDFFTNMWVIGSVSVITGILLAAVGYYVFLVTDIVRFEKDLTSEREKLRSEQQYWETVVQKYPGYRDAYFQVAQRAYQLGEKTKSQDYLKKALALDPNYEPGRKLEQALKNGE